MADDRNDWRGERSGGGPRRTNSIFSDDDRSSDRDWNPEQYGWGRRSESGGAAGGGGRRLFERARDEVSSWFGNDDDRGGRGAPERSRYGQGQSGFGGEHYRSNRSGAGWEGASGGDAYPRREQSGTSHFDENYRRWREQQIARLDQEYEEYCRERQQRFESDFHSWRESRQGKASAGGETGGSEEPRSDFGGASSGGGLASSRSALLGDDEAAKTTAGGGDASAMEASTGSSPAAGGDRPRTGKE
jgi:hypothetical protein